MNWRERLAERAARRRWNAIIRRARNGPCFCGEPATVVRYLGRMGVGGEAEAWSCAEHYGVIGWEIPRDGGAPIPIAWAA